MSRRLPTALLALFTVLALSPATIAHAQTTPTTPAVAAKANLIDLEDEVMCVVCGRPLSTSGGSAAEDERAFIQDLIAKGLDKSQIKEQMVAEYGKDALVKDDSPIAGAAPVIAAIVGAGSIALLLRRRRAGTRGDLAGAVAAGGPLPDPDGNPAAAAAALADEPVLAPTAPSAEDDARIDAELAERD
jgi:cytochrome c-type biogenesis protein CcmH/NrfF